MTQLQRMLDYLWSIAPTGATNAAIARATGITSHQAVYMGTQDLLSRGRIHSERQAFYFLADTGELEKLR